MLSKLATALVISLCDSVKKDSYVVMNFSDIAKKIDLEDNEAFQEIWEDVRLNGCVTIKYKDKTQACFTMTDKARLITQDVKAMQLIKEPKKSEENNDQNDVPMILNTDEMGRNIFVMPQSESVIKRTKKNKSHSFLWGILGGIIGGIISGGILYFILNMLIGG